MEQNDKSKSLQDPRAKHVEQMGKLELFITKYMHQSIPRDVHLFIWEKCESGIPDTLGNTGNTARRVL